MFWRKKEKAVWEKKEIYPCEDSDCKFYGLHILANDKNSLRREILWEKRIKSSKKGWVDSYPKSLMWCMVCKNFRPINNWVKRHDTYSPN